MVGSRIGLIDFMKNVIPVFACLILANGASAETICDFDDVECAIANLTPKENAART